MYMTKYTRSLQKLVALIKDIFGDNDLSVDTKALVLFLAGTMSNLKFNSWIDRIQELDILNTKYKEINGLKNILGGLCFEYIMLYIVNILKHDINSDELQQYIGGSSNIDPNIHIESAFTSNRLAAPANDITQAKQVAISVLIKKSNNIKSFHLTALLDAYVCCRQSLDPNTAYHALEAAIVEILISSGLTTVNAQDYSSKLMKYSLEDLIDINGQNKVILHSYKQGSVLR